MDEAKQGKGENTPLPKFTKSISLLTWGLNEQDLIDEFMEKTVSFLEEICDDFEIIFVDDKSTDETPALLNKWQKLEPRLRVITNEKNLNVGWNTRIAVAAAQKDYILWQMVDWCYDISNLRAFLELLKYVDVVQGIRVGPPRNIYRVPILGTVVWALQRSDNLWKGFISLVNYAMLRILFRVHFHDFQNVTIYPRKLAQSLELTSTTSFINPEMLLKIYWSGASYIEVPIDFIPRNKGKAKGTKVLPVLRSIREILFYWWKWIIQGEISTHNPGAIQRVEHFLRKHRRLQNIFPQSKNPPDN